jgi:hypothetical protein
MKNEFREVIGADTHRDIERVICSAREAAYYRMLSYGLTIAAVAIVYIRLGCMEGTGCVSAQTWANLTAPHLTPAQEFWNLWEFG